MALKFPSDFIKRNHPTIEGAIQWVYPKDAPISTPILISIVTDSRYFMINDDGQFEMWDMREGGELIGYMTFEDINRHLAEHYSNS